MLAFDLLEPVEEWFTVGAIERDAPMAKHREVAPECPPFRRWDYDLTIGLSPRGNGKIGPSL